MAKINQSAQRKWNDGDVIHGAEYNQERDLIIAAHNDTQDQVDALKSTTAPAVSTGMLQDQAVTNPKLADNAVGTAKIQDSSVQTSKLADLSVTNAKLGASSISTDKLQDGSVTTPKLADGNVTAGKLAIDSVATDRIQNEAVTEQKIAPGAVTSAKILARAILSSHMAANSVGPDAIVAGAVGSIKLEDGAVTPTKITKEAITQYAYDMATTDQRIADALSAGVPQDVIDQIRNSISGDVSQLRTDVGDMEGLPPGMSLTGAFLDINGTVNTHIYDDEIHVTQALQDSWNAKPTVDDVTNMVNNAETNAVDSANFYANNKFFSKDSALYPNLVKNSGALFGFNNWSRISDIGPWATAWASDVGGYFYNSGAVPSGQYAILDSDNIPVAPGAVYTYSAMYMTAGVTAGGVVQTEIHSNTGATIVSQAADNNKGWHRKTMTVTIPAGVSSIWVRLVMTNVPAVTKAISRVQLTFGNQESAYTAEGDLSALFQYANDGKNNIAAAITGKGVAASGSDSFSTLSTKIGQISSSPIGLKVSTATGLPTGAGTISNLAFKPVVAIFRVQFNSKYATQGDYSYSYLSGYLVGYKNDGGTTTTTGTINSQGWWANYTRTDGYASLTPTFGSNSVSYSIAYGGEVYNPVAVTATILGV